jgi:hypothetical protein
MIFQICVELIFRMAITYCLYIFHFNISMDRNLFVKRLWSIHSFCIAQTKSSMLTIECLCYDLMDRLCSVATGGLESP